MIARATTTPERSTRCADPAARPLRGTTPVPGSLRSGPIAAVVVLPLIGLLPRGEARGPG